MNIAAHIPWNLKISYSINIINVITKKKNYLYINN